jgi:hypothetical protein
LEISPKNQRVPYIQKWCSNFVKKNSAWFEYKVKSIETWLKSIGTSLDSNLIYTWETNLLLLKYMRRFKHLIIPEKWVSITSNEYFYLNSSKKSRKSLD